MSRVPLVGVMFVVAVLGLAPLSCSSQATPESGWGVAQLIENNDAGGASRGAVAVDAMGNALATWHQYDGVRYEIWANRYVDGIGWGAPVSFGTEGPGNAFSPHLAVDGMGNAMAVWWQWEASVTRIWSSSYVFGVGWGAPVPVETGTLGGSYNPKVVMDSEGNAMAAWHRQDVTYNIWASRYVVGHGWQEPAPIAPDETLTQEEPDVVMDRDGVTTVVWSQWDGVRWGIWSCRHVPAVGWGDALPVETDEAGSAFSPYAAVDGDNNVFAVWRQSEGALSNIWANRYVPGSGWETAQIIEDDDVNPALSPHVAADEAGNAVAVWIHWDGTLYDVWANRYVVGEGWGTAVLIETEDAGSASSPKVAMGGDGNAVAVWSQSDGSVYSIWSNECAADGSWRSAQLIETRDEGNAAAPYLAMNRAGVAFAMWHQNDGVRYNIWANRYVVPDTTPPVLEVHYPYDGLTVDTPSVSVQGVTEVGVSLTVNGLSVAVAPNGSFSCMVALPPASSYIVVIAVDGAGNSAVVTRLVTYADPVAALEDALAGLEGELADARNELAILEDALAALEDELDEVRSELSDAKSQGMVLIVALLAFCVVFLLLLAVLLKRSTGPRRPMGRTQGEAAPPMSSAMEGAPAKGPQERPRQVEGAPPPERPLGGSPESGPRESTAMRSEVQGAPAKKPRKPKAKK